MYLCSVGGSSSQVLAPLPNIQDTTGLVVAHTVASVRGGVTVARVLNPTGNAVVLKPGLHLGERYPVEEADVMPLDLSREVTAVQPLCAELPVTLDGSPITSQQREDLSWLLQRFSGVFSLYDCNTGKCALTKPRIRTGDHPPIKQRTYRAYPEKRQVAGLLADGLVEESCSPWASPVVLVKKKGGQWRFCIDYRCLNPVTIKDSHPLPRVDDSLDALAGSPWFSTLDFSNGYW